MKEHHLTVMKTARYMTLGASSKDVRQVGFVCHGYGQPLKSFLDEFAVLDDGARLIVAPEGLSRFYVGDGLRPAADAVIGASWMTREDREHEISDYVNYLDVLYARIFKSIDRAKVGVFILGFSQGAATASRWVGQGTIAVDHLILWGGGLPPDLDLAAKKTLFKRLRLTLAAGSADPLFDAQALAAQEAQLDAFGIERDVVRYEGGHGIDGGVLQRIIGRSP